MAANPVPYEEPGQSVNIARGEKENDLVVATRQKHNGMSWSPPGSIALAALAIAARNQEVDRWFRTGQIEFKLAA